MTHGHSNTILQVSILPQPEYVIDQLMQYFPGWNYINFARDRGSSPPESELIEYIINNPIEGFPGAEERINYFTRGQYRADFFRYYWLYLNGGGFIDSDCMIEKNILNDVDHYDIVTVINRLGGERGTEFLPGIFNGLLFVKPRNECIRIALDNMYHLRINESRIDANPQVATQDLYKIMQKDTRYTKKFYEEKYIRYSGENGIQGGTLIMDGNDLAAAHYHDEKIIPRISMRQQNGVNIRQQRLPGVRIHTENERFQWVATNFAKLWD